uniref:Uncharacterized protein n=2 Tax=Odontella aurita TaxID=265563 RepID=A0A7S4J3V7_9STRA|mmetsp:Transcript_37560/g.112611  ORF Transcript_37560/g.112611 Transcript_37560/m.112611 type:complete len:149 (+) Transcript_37560:299-745(+)
MNKVYVRWEDQDLSYLQKDTFRDKYYKRVMNAKAVNKGEVLAKVKFSNVRLVYRSFDEFAKYAMHFKLYHDERGGVARSAYENIVEFRPFVSADNGKKVSSKYLAFVAPPLDELCKNFEAGAKLSPNEFAKTLILNPGLHTGDVSSFK